MGIKKIPRNGQGSGLRNGTTERWQGVWTAEDVHSCHQSQPRLTTVVTNPGLDLPQLSPIPASTYHSCHQSRPRLTTVVTNPGLDLPQLSPIPASTYHSCHQSRPRLTRAVTNPGLDLPQLSLIPASTYQSCHQSRPRLTRAVTNPGLDLPQLSPIPASTYHSCHQSRPRLTRAVTNPGLDLPVQWRQQTSERDDWDRWGSGCPAQQVSTDLDRVTPNPALTRPTGAVGGGRWAVGGDRTGRRAGCRCTTEVVCRGSQQTHRRDGRRHGAMVTALHRLMGDGGRLWEQAGLIEGDGSRLELIETIAEVGGGLFEFSER